MNKGYTLWSGKTSTVPVAIMAGNKSAQWKRVVRMHAGMFLGRKGFPNYQIYMPLNVSIAGRQRSRGLSWSPWYPWPARPCGRVNYMPYFCVWYISLLRMIVWSHSKHWFSKYFEALVEINLEKHNTRQDFETYLSAEAFYYKEHVVKAVWKSSNWSQHSHRPAVHHGGTPDQWNVDFLAFRNTAFEVSWLSRSRVLTSLRSFPVEFHEGLTQY